MAVGDSPTDGYLTSWRLAVVTASLCLGTFLVALDVNIIGVALPKITSVFDSLDDVSWYGTAYLLTVTAFQPTMGFLYKSFNVRLVYFSNVLILEGGCFQGRHLVIRCCLSITHSVTEVLSSGIYPVRSCA